MASVMPETHSSNSPTRSGLTACDVHRHGRVFDSRTTLSHGCSITSHLVPYCECSARHYSCPFAGSLIHKSTLFIEPRRRRILGTPHTGCCIACPCGSGGWPIFPPLSLLPSSRYGRSE